MTAALEGGEWSAARPGRTLPPGKTRYPLYRRLGGPQGRSGRTENLVPTGIRSRTVQPGSSVAIPTELPGPLYLIRNKGPQNVEHFSNIATKCTSSFVTHTSITSLLHVSLCYTLLLQGKPLLTLTKPSALY